MCFLISLGISLIFKVQRSINKIEIAIVKKNSQEFSLVPFNFKVQRSINNKFPIRNLYTEMIHFVYVFMDFVS